MQGQSQDQFRTESPFFPGPVLALQRKEPLGSQIRHPMETVTARPSRLWLHLLLFALTVLTTYSAYSWSFGGSENLEQLRVESLAFSLSLMAILGSHEMGHYVLARIHKVDTTLPYFIPLPYVGVG